MLVGAGVGEGFEHAAEAVIDHGGQRVGIAVGAPGAEHGGAEGQWRERQAAITAAGPVGGPPQQLVPTDPVNLKGDFDLPPGPDQGVGFIDSRQHRLGEMGTALLAGKAPPVAGHLQIEGQPPFETLPFAGADHPFDLARQVPRRRQLDHPGHPVIIDAAHRQHGQADGRIPVKSIGDLKAHIAGQPRHPARRVFVAAIAGLDAASEAQHHAHKT